MREYHLAGKQDGFFVLPRGIPLLLLVVFALGRRSGVQVFWDELWVRGEQAVGGPVCGGALAVDGFVQEKIDDVCIPWLGVFDGEDRWTREVPKEGEVIYCCGESIAKTFCGM